MYKSPCEKCGFSDCCYIGCNDWRIRYLYRQKQINAYAKNLRSKRLQPVAQNKFTYMHPDEARRFLRKHPCSDCSIENICDQPCQLYIDWYSSRMDCARRRAKL